MSEVEELPPGLELVRVTPTFDENTIPAGLLKAHQVAAGVWGRLVVHSGAVRFVFEDSAEPHELHAGSSIAIPPQRPHHLEVIGPVRLAVEFHRPPDDSVDAPADRQHPATTPLGLRADGLPPDVEPGATGAGSSWRRSGHGGPVGL